MILVLQRFAWRLVLSLAVVAFAATPASADLIGISVTGNLEFLGFPGINFFDPANGEVPPGAPNASGPTVTIVDPGVEFQFDDNFAQINADFGPSSLAPTELLIQIPPSAQEVRGWSMGFTGLGAAGALINVVQMSSTFPDLTFAFSANKISLSFPGAPLPPVDTGFSAAFSITQAVVDEPSTLVLLWAALVVLGVASYHRRHPYPSPQPRHLR